MSSMYYIENISLGLSCNVTDHQSRTLVHLKSNPQEVLVGKFAAMFAGEGAISSHAGRIVLRQLCATETQHHKVFIVHDL